MKRRYLSLTILALLAVVIAAPVAADLGYNPGSVTTIFDFLCFTTKHCSAHVNINSAGTEVGTSGNPLSTNAQAAIAALAGPVLDSTGQQILGTTTQAHGCSTAGYSVVSCAGQIDDDLKGPIPQVTAPVAPSSSNLAVSSLLAGCQYLSSTPTLLNLQQMGIPCTVSGELLTAPGPSSFIDPCGSSGIAKSQVAINVTSATTTALVAISGTTTVYVCGFSFTVAPSATSADTAQLEYGAGTACATSPVVLTGSYGAGDLTTSAPPLLVSYGGGGQSVAKTAASNGLCLVSAGTTVNIQGMLTYVQR